MMPTEAKIKEPRSMQRKARGEASRVVNPPKIVKRIPVIRWPHPLAKDFEPMM